MTPMDYVIQALELSFLMLVFLVFYVVLIAPDSMLSDDGLNLKYYPRKLIRKIKPSEDEN